MAADDREVQKLSNIETREVGASSAIDRIPELNEDTVVSRAERLESSAFLDDTDQRKRRNDTLFLGNYFLI